MAEKDFICMLNNSKDMPKVITVTDEKTIHTYGGTRMVIAPPIDYYELIMQLPQGKVATIVMLREILAKRYSADFTDPMTAGIFTVLSAHASNQKNDEAPYWRLLKSRGELNEKYPGGIEEQKRRLESEGHAIIATGKKNIRYFVFDYEKVIFNY